MAAKYVGKGPIPRGYGPYCVRSRSRGRRATAVCRKEHKDRIARAYKETEEQLIENALSGLYKRVARYFDGCGFKGPGYCMIFYRDHVNLEAEWLVREARIEARKILYDYKNVECVCQTRAKKPQKVKELCKCAIPVTEEDECEKDKDVEDPPSGGANPNTSCGGTYSGAGVGSDSPEYNWGYISKPTYEEVVVEDHVSSTCDEAEEGLSISMDEECPSDDERDQSDDPAQPPPPLEYTEGDIVDGYCICEPPDEEDEDEDTEDETDEFEYKRQGGGGFAEDEDAEDDASPPADEVRTESYIDLLKSETVSQYGYPLEHIFGTHFTYGNIFWVDKLTTYQEDQLSEAASISTYGGAGTQISSDITILSSLISKRDMRFAIGFCAAGPEHVSRMWLEDYLALDTSSPQNATSDRIEVYSGGETSKVSRDMTEAVGFGRSPAYRDLMWAMVDGEDVIHEIPQVRAEVKANTNIDTIVESAYVSMAAYAADVTAEHFSVDAVENKIRVSLTGNRLLVLDAASFDVLEIVDFDADLQLSTMVVGQRTGDHVVQSQPVDNNFPDRRCYENFVRREGTVHFRPGDTHNSYGYSGQYELYQTDTLFTSDTPKRKWPILRQTVMDKHYIHSRGPGDMVLYDDLQCWIAYRVQSQRSNNHVLDADDWGDSHTIQDVSTFEMPFSGFGNAYTSGVFYIKGNSGETAARDYPVGLMYYPLTIGDPDIAENYSLSTYIATFVSATDINVHAEDVVVRGAFEFEKDLIVVGTYAGNSKHFAFRWNAINGVVWRTSLEQRPPYVETGLHLTSSSFVFMSDETSPRLFSLDCGTGDTKDVTGTATLQPYKIGHRALMVYDNEARMLTYLGDDGVVHNVFPNAATTNHSSVGDVLRQMQDSLVSRGIPFQLDARHVDAIPTQGFRTGSLLSWKDVMLNLAQTYDLVLYEDNGMTAAPRANSSYADISATKDWKTEALDTTTYQKTNRVDFSYYDEDALGSQKLITVQSSGELEDTEYSFAFTSGGLLSSSYAYQIAELLLSNKGLSEANRVSASVGAVNLLLTPGDILFGDYQISRMSITLSEMQLNSGKRVFTTIDAPEIPRTIVRSKAQYEQRRPLVKPMIVRPPLVLPRTSGYVNGNIGKQVGLAWVDARVQDNVLEEDNRVLQHPLIWGRATTVLPVVKNVFTTDYDSSVSVMFSEVPPAFADATWEQLVTDPSVNVLACGLETVQFMTAVQDDTEPRLWTFSGLLRGRFGTDTAVADHLTNEMCVFYDTSLERFTTYDVTGQAEFGNFVNDTAWYKIDRPSGFGRLSAACVQEDRTARNVGETMWSDDIGRNYAPVNVQRIDDPLRHDHYIVWDFRDASGNWFRDTLVNYTRTPSFDVHFTSFRTDVPPSNGGNFGFDHQIARDYEARAGQQYSDVVSSARDGWSSSDSYYSLRRSQVRITRQDARERSAEATRERHVLQVYVYDRNYSAEWGSLPALVSFDVRGWGYFDELYNGRAHAFS